MTIGYRSYKNKLLAFLLLAICLPLFLFALVSSHKARTISYDDFVRFTASQLNSIDDHLSQFLQVVENNAVYLSSHPTIRQADPSITSYVEKPGHDGTIPMTPSTAGGREAEIFAVYRQFAEAHPQTAFLYLGLENGSYVQWPEGKTKGLYDPRQRPWYQRALANPGKPIRTKAYDGGAANKVIVSTVRTITDGNDEIIGVQGVDMDLGFLTTLAEKARVGRRGFLIITEEDGTVLAHSRHPEFNFQPLATYDAVLAQAVASGTGFVHTSCSGVLYSGIIRKSPFSSWNFIGMIEESELLESSRLLGGHLLWTFLVIALFFILLSLAISRTFSQPIFSIVDQLKEIGNGNFAVDIPADIRERNDELGILARAGESLRKNLSDKVHKLETLNHTARILVSTLDWRQTLDFSASIILEVAQADRVVILLAERDETEFQIAIARGIEGVREVDGKYPVDENRFPLKIEFSEGEKIKATPSIMRTGGPGKSEPIESPFIRQWLESTRGTHAIPLLVKSRFTGFIFTEAKNEDAEFLDTVSRQIGCFIENSRLFHDAITDGLTGLFIHRYFQMQLNKEIKRAMRYHSAVSLVMIDIDHFKKFNDTYGHQIGDRVLRGVARTITQSIREVDLACRYGGEEMAIILPETNLKQAQIVGEKIRKAVEQEPYVPEETVTISIGISQADPEVLHNNELLIRAADQCLYEAKHHGRNRVVISREGIGSESPKG